MLKTIIAYSKISKESHRHPLEKLCLCIFPMIILGFVHKPLPLILNIFIFLILHIKANNPKDIVLKFNIGILSFSLLSSITLLFVYNFNYILVIILKGVSGGMCISYLTLTTPLDHILSLVSKITPLQDICDIAKSMELYILLINDEASSIYNAMSCRHGFHSFKSKIKNMSKLAGLLFLNTLKRWPEIQDGLYNRCYAGRHYYSQCTSKLSYKFMLMMFMYNIILLALCFI
ncbi:CbiQ family ECF transporter T component [Clostridium senegalense]